MENDKPEHTDKNTTLSYEHKMLEGYKGLNLWQCQESQDHINFDRIFMPLLIAAPMYALLQADGHQGLQTLIVAGSSILLLFWILRNLRIQHRMLSGFKVMNEVECKLNFNVRRRFRDEIDKSKMPRDFTLKYYFAGCTFVFYLGCFIYVWWPNIVSWCGG